VSRTIRTIKSGACGKEPKVDVIDEHHSQLNNKARVTAVCNNRSQAFPTLFVLGGQKCGSTTLFHDALKAIPALMQPSRHANEATYFGKELHFCAFFKGFRSVQLVLPAVRRRAKERKNPD
jgi:hypothetical protein